MQSPPWRTKAPRRSSIEAGEDDVSIVLSSALFDLQLSTAHFLAASSSAVPRTAAGTVPLLFDGSAAWDEAHRPPGTPSFLAAFSLAVRWPASPHHGPIWLGAIYLCLADCRLGNL
ncbi:hypothetical protein EJB05_03167 [Eragrostis curvula]|uniref:Uncharacterized protein n=1 Tax=Eragrostis curvula TaxID=38414 RepID=A0A5J9WVG6_9POAL|nr:hypothetical protein EJB05_03167 [Eragrostis curvula]